MMVDGIILFVFILFFLFLVGIVIEGYFYFKKRRKSKSCINCESYFVCSKMRGTEKD